MRPRSCAPSKACATSRSGQPVQRVSASMLHESLHSTAHLLERGYPSGLEHNDRTYCAVVTLLAETMSVRALACVLEEVIGIDYALGYHDVLCALSGNGCTQAELDVVRARLHEAGLAGWLAENA
jgi:hypothetical protein